jgi:hypothetical protein
VSGTDPGQHLFWLSSRAFGVVAALRYRPGTRRRSRRPRSPSELTATTT